MSSPRLMWNVTRPIVVASLLSIAASITPASAASFFFFKANSHAPRETTCMNFALDAARNRNLQNIQHGPLAVSGTRGDFFANLTCVGTVVVVMVAGNTGENPQPLAKELFDAVMGEQCIDEPC